jgi:hypothetical protein
LSLFCRSAVPDLSTTFTLKLAHFDRKIANLALQVNNT